MTVTVELLRVPLALYDRAAAHHADLMRELMLINLSDTSEVPRRLQQLIDDLSARFAGVGSPLGNRQAGAASSADLVYDVAVQAGADAAELLRLLHEIDVYCSGEHLITLPTPPDQVAFFTWYLGEFVRQTRGEPPRAWPGELG